MKLIEADEAELAKLMSDEIEIDDTELGKQRRFKLKADNLRLIAMMKERGEEEVLQVIRGAVSLASMVSAGNESTSVDVVNSDATTIVLRNP